MNKENLQRVIDAISIDGATKFNMSAFIGKFEEEYKVENVFQHGELASTYKSDQVSFITEGTDIFNCTSMGCIAGFATAIFNNWKSPKWLEGDDTIDFVRQFERESNDFLGFSYEEGRNIYYNNDRCIWKWLMVNEPDRYDFKLEGEYETMDEATEYGEDWDSGDLYVDFSTIDYLSAVNVLTRILNEEIGLADDYNEPYYVNQEALV
jgi:hypothetical protein